MSLSLKFVVSAPGKVILFGEHSVVYGKPALAASINKRSQLHFETITNDYLDLSFASLTLNVKIPLISVRQILNQHWIAVGECAQQTRSINQEEIELLKHIIKQIEELKFMDERQRISILCIFVLLSRMSNTKIGIQPFKIFVSTELIVGAGTGSSASFSVCLSAALWRFHQLLCANGNFINGKFSAEDKRIINDYAFCCEQIIHGKASGVDNFVCTYGSIVKVISTNGKKSFQMLENAHQLRILLVNTGQTRNTANLVKFVSEVRVRNSTVVDCILNSMAVLCEEAESVIIQLQDYNQGGESLKYLFKKLEDLVSLNHGLLVSLGVSNEVLDTIVNTTKQFELASKLTGAGGGGYAITLISPFSNEETIEKCKKTLQSKGFSVEDIRIGTSGVDIEIL